MRALLLTILLICSFKNSFCQANNDANIAALRHEINGLKSANSSLQSELKNLKSNFSNMYTVVNDSMEILKVRLRTNEQRIQNINQQLGMKISTTENNANKKIETLDDTIGKNTLYWAIAVLAIALLSILLFALLRKQLTKNNSDLSDNIQQTKKALEEEGVKLDNKLVDLLATQMLLMKEERRGVPSIKAEEVNHELALNTANEIVRIQQNLSKMDASTKGFKQLNEAAKRMIERDFSNTDGYEIIEMLNKPYDQGMKVIANFRPDETLNAGEQIVTRIIKPQVNFKGVMIQSAQIEVSQGE